MNLVENEPFDVPGIRRVWLAAKAESAEVRDGVGYKLTAFVATGKPAPVWGHIAYYMYESVERGVRPFSFDRVAQLYLLRDIFSPCEEGLEEYRSQLDPAKLEEEEERRKGLEAIFDEEGDAEKFYLGVVQELEELEESEGSEDDSWEEGPDIDGSGRLCNEDEEV